MGAVDSALATVERLRRPVVSFGPFTFDPNSQILRRGTDSLTLPPRVLGVLECLLGRAGDLVPRQEIIDGVWKDAFVTDTSLAEAVSFLRQALGDDPQAPTYIQTVHRRGYRFVAPVQTTEAEPLIRRLDAPRRDEAAEPVSPSIGGSLVPWTAAVLCAALAIAAVWQLLMRGEPAAPPVGRFALQLSDKLTFDSHGPAITLSWDGSRAAWSACDGRACQLFLRPLDRLDTSAVAATTGATDPFFSPDGRWLGFFADGKLKKVSLAGGLPVTLADVAEPRGAVWTPDGRIVFGASRAGGLMQISEAGGQAELLTTPDEGQGELRHEWPSITRDGRTLLFSIATTPQNGSPTRLGLAALGRAGASIRWTSPLSGIGIARFGANDLIVFSRGSELEAVAFDPVRLTLSGVPQNVVSSAATAMGRGQFAISGSGSLLYVVPPESSDPDDLLEWVTQAGSTPIPDLAQPSADAVLSSDGRRIAWSASNDPSRADIWVGDLQRGAVTRLTHDGLNVSPAWSPDGRTIYFSRRDSARYGPTSIDADGGQPSALPPLDHHALPASVSPDGSTLAVVQFQVGTRGDIWAMPTRGGGARPLVRSPFDDVEPAFSPAGRLLAYQSDEAGRWDVYVQRLEDNRRVVVSTTGGEHPFWSTDGSRVYYRSGSRLMSATVSADDMRVGTPSIVMDNGNEDVLGVAPDGRFLVRRRTAPASSNAVIVNEWLREVRSLLGPPAASMPR
jgi:serine/threonine-protein kinase